MVDRTIKLETANRKTNLRPLTVVLTVVACLTAIRYLLPTPPERLRTSQVSDENLIAFVKSVTFTPPAVHSSTLGESIFHDNDFLPYQPGRRGQNESCSGCHSRQQDSALLTSERQAPDLRRTRFYSTFSSDGRAKDLDTYLTQHIEGPTELASNRLRVVRLIFEKHRDQYQNEFGPLPQLKISDLPDQGLPARDRKEFPIIASSFILETLADRHQLADILSQAQAEHLAPAVIVSRRVFSPMLPAHEVTDSYLKLPNETRAAVDKIFSNTVHALATYVKTLTPPAVVFDRFAEALGKGQSLEQSLSTEFGNEELTGLRLFYGHAGCARCHNGAGFTDNQFHNIGLPTSKGFDPGHAIGLVLAEREKICSSSENYPSEEHCHLVEPTAESMKTAIGSFRTAALRGFNPQGPLTHTGQISDLDGMIAFYNQLNDRPAIGKRSELLTSLHLTKEEEAALTAFLLTLGSPSALVGSNPGAAKF